MRFVTSLLLFLAAASSSASTLTDFSSVRSDLKSLFRNSQTFWPADFGHYGPFFIRLAWHCSGSYRLSDGRGGCDGARQRFDPERSWDDNTNLDKARKLLEPIKLKYGDALSWGDLIVLAGTTAIEDMGGPVLGFCGGRIDDKDGSASIKLGPSSEQEAIAPCPVNGKCSAPLGATTVGLIYVNPEGPMGVPDPKASAPQVRDTFYARMSMNDSETVALIGGGHAFGKAHGACPLGAGPAPKDQPQNPWPGNCGDGADKGKGANAFTSGFEGSWTTTPTKWSNQYFQNLVNFNWTVGKGPGGHNQWKPSNSNSKIMMFTSDVSLLNDPKYTFYVNLFAKDSNALNNAFSHAWYKLVSRDMGPVTRCTGERIPPAQIFQNPLPPMPSKSEMPDFDKVRSLIQTAFGSDSNKLAEFVHLAYQCSSTFRATDYLGGCNGARIRFAPENTWANNRGTNDIIADLKSKVKDQYYEYGKLSYADLIVFAGQVALEQSSGLKFSFCFGRTDAEDGQGSEYLAPRKYNDFDPKNTILNVRDLQEISGLSARQMVALKGRLRPATQQKLNGYSGSWTTDSSKLSNAFYSTLLAESWELQVSTGGRNEYKAAGKDIFMTPEDLTLIYDPEYLAIVQEYASNNQLFLTEFASAWTHLVQADRFSGPTGNVCNAQATF